MRTWRLNPIVIGLLLATVPLPTAAGRTERTRNDDTVVADPEGGPGTVRLATTGVGEPSGGVAGGQACEQIAEYLDLNSGVNRMRGNVYEIGDIPAILDEFKMELDERYGERIEGMEVVPVLRQHGPRYVYVLGDVQRPGRYVLDYSLTVKLQLKPSLGD